MCRSIREGGRRCPHQSSRGVEHALTSVKRWETKLEALEDDGAELDDERFSHAFDRYQDACSRLVERERQRGEESSAHGPAEPTRAEEFTPETVSALDEAAYTDTYSTVWDSDPEAAYSFAAAGDESSMEWDEEEGEWYEPDEHDEIGAQAGNLTRAEYAREEFERYQMGAYLDAEEKTSGSLLNKEGQAAGVDSFSLFSGPAERASRYASDELKAYWQQHGRHTVASHRYTILKRPSDRAAYDYAMESARFDDAAAVL